MEERNNSSGLRINSFDLIPFVLVTTATTQSQIIKLSFAAPHLGNDVIYGESLSGDGIQTSAILASLLGAFINGLPLSVRDTRLTHRWEL
jgi:hypothetical protein